MRLSQLGLYTLRNRFYSPTLGRFLQPDPIGHEGDAYNVYRYCGNDPVNAVDPTGLNATLWGVAIHGDGSLGNGTYVGLDDSFDDNAEIGAANQAASNSTSGASSSSSGTGGNHYEDPNVVNNPFYGAPPPNLTYNPSPISADPFSNLLSGAADFTTLSFLPSGGGASTPAGSIGIPSVSDLELSALMQGINSSLQVMDYRNDSLFGFYLLQAHFDTYFLDSPDLLYEYTGVDFPEISGLILTGRELNYMAVGAGFNARGWTLSSAENGVSLWNNIFHLGAPTYGMGQAAQAGYDHYISY